MAVIVFDHGDSLKRMPPKLLRYISAIGDAEMKEGSGNDEVKKQFLLPHEYLFLCGDLIHRREVWK